MKLFNTFFEVLSSKKNLKLKKNMGFPIHLSDIENLTYGKKKVRRRKI